MKILFLSAEDGRSESSSHRYEVLAASICQDRKHSAKVMQVMSGITGNDIGIIDVYDSDVIILSAELLILHYKSVQKWKANGKIVIADLCTPIWFDDLEEGGRSDSALMGYTRELFSPGCGHSSVRSFRWGIRLVDAVICNSRTMAEDWSEKTSVYYLPDYINVDDYLIHGHEQHGGVIIGLKLLKNGYDKVVDTGLLSAIETIGREKPETKFLFYGDLIQLQRKVKLYPEQKMYIPIRELGDWQKVLSTIDIGLIPLSGMEDDRVGWFDALEYMLMKIPWVASENNAFAELRHYGWLVQNHANLWERILLDMVGNIQAYKEDTAGEPYLFAIGQGKDEYIEKLFKIINFCQSNTVAREMVSHDTDEYYARR